MPFLTDFASWRDEVLSVAGNMCTVRIGFCSVALLALISQPNSDVTYSPRGCAGLVLFLLEPLGFPRGIRTVLCVALALF